MSRAFHFLHQSVCRFLLIAPQVLAPPAILVVSAGKSLAAGTLTGSYTTPQKLDPVATSDAATIDAMLERTIGQGVLTQYYYASNGADGGELSFDAAGGSIMGRSNRRVEGRDQYRFGDFLLDIPSRTLTQRGKAVGNVHGVNPGMIGDGHAATTPTIMGVQIGATAIDCRWLQHTRFIGVDSRRSIAVVETPQGLVYQSFDFAKRGPVTHPAGGEQSNRPTLRIAGGSEIVGARGGFRFVNDGYVYVVQRPRASEPATVVVTRNGRVINSETLVGFTYAPPSGGAPERLSAALGPEAVWSGAGLDMCRGKADAHVADDCLLDQMRRSGASAGSIAFTKRLIAADSPGYVAGWRQAGPVGIATVTYPFRANTNSGTMLVPASARS